MNDQTEGRRPNPVDLYVGGRVRMRRKLLGVSQDQLAEALGLTFQQVQKYERGANRVSASKLYQIAKALQVPVSFFFDGLADLTNGETGDPVTSNVERGIQAFLSTPEGLELAQLFPRIHRGRVRRQVLDLVRTMTDDMDSDET